MAPRVVSSAEVIASNDDLLAEIFVRLPVRPLIRFQCVSKQWLALISGRSFSHRHARRNIRSASALFLRRSSYGRSRYGLMEPEFEFDFVSFGGASDADDPLKSIGFVEIPSGLTILQSCNGLLLCSSRGCVDSNFLYYIYNPSTSKFLELPALVGGDSPTVLAINLAFDPAKSPNYQVVCVRSTEVSVYCYQTEIYSSETGKWRLSGAPFTSQLRMVFGKGVFWNGSSIWVGLGKVFYYNLEQERFGTIPLPFELEGTRFQYFGESGGHLHLIELCESPIVHFKVFEMEKDYCGWRVKYQIDLRPIRNAFTEVYPEYHAPFYNVGYFTFFVLSLVREEDDDAASLVLHIPGKIILFNLKDMSYKRLQDVEPTCGDIKGSLQYGWYDAFQYIESLSCV